MLDRDRGLENWANRNSSLINLVTLQALYIFLMSDIQQLEDERVREVQLDNSGPCVPVSEVRAAEAELSRLEVAYDEAVEELAEAEEEPDDTPETRKRYRIAKASVARVGTQLERARELRQLLNEDLRRQCRGESRAPSEGTVGSVGEKAKAKRIVYPSSTPTFKKSGDSATMVDPVAFIEELENKMEGAYIEKKHWSRAVLAHVGNRDLAAYVRDELLDKDWPEAKAAFLRKSMTKEVVDKYQEELKFVSMGRTEPVGDFVDRYKRIVRNCGRIMDEYDIVDKFVDCLYYELRIEIRRKMCESPEWKTNYDRTSEYAKLMCTHFKRKDRNDKDGKIDGNRRLKNDKNNQDGKEKGGKKVGEEDLNWFDFCYKNGLCKNCGEPGHLKNECPEKRILRCFGCGEKGVKQDNCKKCKGKQAGTKKLNKTELVKEEEDFSVDMDSSQDDININEYSPLLLSLGQNDSLNELLVVELSYAGQPVKALVDCGATAFFADPTWAKRAGLVLEPAKGGTVQLCGKGKRMVVARLGETKDVEFQYGERTAKINVEWYELCNGRSTHLH